MPIGVAADELNLERFVQKCQSLTRSDDASTPRVPISNSAREVKQARTCTVVAARVRGRTTREVGETESPIPRITQISHPETRGLETGGGSSEESQTATNFLILEL